MRNWFGLLLILLVLTIAGCSGETDSSTDEAKQEDEEAVSAQSNEIDADDYESGDVVATLDEGKISGKDLTYEIKRLELMTALQKGGSEKKAQTSPMIALQEIFERRMVHRIAVENDIEVDEDEQYDRAEEVRKDVETEDVYDSIMDDEDIDEETFWSREEERYESILETEALIDVLEEEEAEETPEQEQRETDEEQFEQQQQANAVEILEDMIQDRMLDADITINN